MTRDEVNGTGVFFFFFVGWLAFSFSISGSFSVTLRLVEAVVFLASVFVAFRFRGASSILLVAVLSSSGRTEFPSEVSLLPST